MCTAEPGLSVGRAVVTIGPWEDVVCSLDMSGKETGNY